MSPVTAAPSPCFIRTIPTITRRSKISRCRTVHSLAVDFQTHRVYAPEQEADGKPVARTAVYEAIGH
jgi:hypothetical protein